MKMADLGCVELRVGLTCDGCGEIIAVNGPRRVARCGCCQKTMALEGALRWQELLSTQSPATDVFKRALTQKDGAVDEGTRDPVKLTVTRAWPKCACGRRFEATKLAGIIAGGGVSIACPTCAAELRVDRPPVSFRTAFPAVVALIGAEVIPDTPPTNPTAVAKSRAKVPAAACTKCGTALDPDGSTRNAPCAKCGVPNRLGDEVWFALHPTQRRAHWWALFDRSRA